MNCIKCGKPADKKYSLDLDIKSIGMCDEHLVEIQLDILVAQLDSKGWKKFKKKYFRNEKN